MASKRRMEAHKQQQHNNRELSTPTTSHSNRSLTVDIISSIDDNAMCDILLLAKDGGEIPASRFVLGARSPVLQRLLFPDTTTSKIRTTRSAFPQLKLPYSTAVVRTLVHYCRTNKLDTGVFFCQTTAMMDETSTREIVHLGQCAVAFQLGGLGTLTANLASSVCQEEPSLACAIFDETVQCATPASDGGGSSSRRSVATGFGLSSFLKDIALGFIRRNPKAALLRKRMVAKSRHYASSSAAGVSFLQATSLEQVLSDSELCTEEINLFQAVMVWADVGVPKDVLHGKKNMDTWTQLLLQDRRVEAKRIVAKCIDLSNIAPSDLMGVVSSSGLVDDVDVSSALIQLALRIEREGVVVSKKRTDGDRSEEERPSFSPPQNVHYLVGEHEEEEVEEEEGTNSVVEAFERIAAAGPDISGSSLSYELVEESNKRKPKKQHPKSIMAPPPKKEPARSTPEKEQALSTPGQVSSSSPAPPPPLVVSSASNDFDESSSKTKRKGHHHHHDRAEQTSVGSEIRRTVGLYLRDKVDSLCVHPKCDLSETS